MTVSIRWEYGSRDDNYNFYKVDVNGNSIWTQVTCNPSNVDSWIHDTKAIHPCLTIGLDVEWRPNTNGYTQNPVATLQLCATNRCLIFQLLHCPYIPPSLAEFLNNTSYTFVGVGIANDASKLLQNYKLRVGNTVDLGNLAVQVTGEGEHRNAGLKTLASYFLKLDVDKPKSVTMSRWDNQRLKPEQVQYACVDAYLSRVIGCTLLSWVRDGQAKVSHDEPVGQPATPNCNAKEAKDKPLINVHYLGERPPKRFKRESEDISFTEADARCIQHPHNDALVVIAKIGKCKVYRILVAEGSSVNLLSYSAFVRIGLHDKDLRPVTVSVHGFSGAFIRPKGSIKLPITLGTAPQEATSVAEFIVIDNLSAYNAIIGRPIMREMKIVTSIYHLSMKFPTSEGIGCVRGCQNATTEQHK